jgi:nitrite reductase/ring-hydroxylating ferredoxin subunit
MSDCPHARSSALPATPNAPAQTSRRGFFATAAGFALALLAWPRAVFAGGKPWVAIPLHKAPKLQEIGGSMVTRIRGKELLVVRDGQNSAHTFEAKCPHEGCDINYAPESQKIECPCHDGRFDLSGKVLAGPPPRPLETYQTIVDGDRLLLHVPE